MSRSSATAGAGSAWPPSASLEKKKTTHRGKREFGALMRNVELASKVTDELKKTNERYKHFACQRELTLHYKRQTVFRVVLLKPLSREGSLCEYEPADKSVCWFCKGTLRGDERHVRHRPGAQPCAV